MTPAIFVIVVGFRGLWNKAPWFCVKSVKSYFSTFFVKTTCFWQGATKGLFSKNAVCTTPIYVYRPSCNHYILNSWKIFEVTKTATVVQIKFPAKKEGNGNSNGHVESAHKTPFPPRNYGEKKVVREIGKLLRINNGDGKEIRQVQSTNQNGRS